MAKERPEMPAPAMMMRLPEIHGGVSLWGLGTSGCSGREGTK